MAQISDNDPVVLVAHGQMQRPAMRRARATPAILAQHMRRPGALSLDDVRYAILESGGRISIVQASAPVGGNATGDTPPPWLDRP